MQMSFTFSQEIVKIMSTDYFLTTLHKLLITKSKGLLSQKSAYFFSYRLVLFLSV
jgi:hypothetical protein